MNSTVKSRAVGEKHKEHLHEQRISREMHQPNPAPPIEAVAPSPPVLSQTITSQPPAKISSREDLVHLDRTKY